MTPLIFLDNQSTTKIDPEVIQAMQPYFDQKYGNPSSLHRFGQHSAGAIQQARHSIASFFHTQNNEIIFTSGATESNNLALIGVTLEAIHQGNKNIHIISSAIEHTSILEPLGFLERFFKIEVTLVKPNAKGIISWENIQDKIRPETILVSIMQANNEIGTIQPIAQIGQGIKDFKNQQDKKIYPLFHCDGSQAPFFLSMDLAQYGVDLYSISAHKIYGPVGIGALYVKQGTPIQPIVFGGEQEYNLRPGTLNTPLIIGLAKAIDLISSNEHALEVNTISDLQHYLMEQLSIIDNSIIFNGTIDPDYRLPNNINISIPSLSSQDLMILLDLQGIAVSVGSACHSKSVKPSHVIQALTQNPAIINSSIRISLSKYTTKQEVDFFLTSLQKILITQFHDNL